MGQQQLLLVILVTIIVGIATVVAINTFSSQAESANVDAARQNALSIASSAQQYYMKPSELGGGGQDFSSITFENIGGVPADIDPNNNQVASNQNGTFEITNRSTGSFDINVYPSSCYSDGATAPNTSCADANDVLTATVQPDAISWGT